MSVAMIKINVNNIYTYLDGKLPKEVTDTLYAELAYQLEGYVFADAYQSGHWDGKTHLYYKKNQSFLTGLLAYAKEILDRYKLDYEIADLREPAVPNMDLSLVDVAGVGNPNVLWEHQQQAIDLGIAKTRGVFEVSTGGGKTTIVAGLVAALGVRPFCFFVLSKDLMYQARDELEAKVLDNNYNRKIEVGIVGDGKCEIRDINIVMVQSAVQALGEEYVPMYSDENTSGTEVAGVEEYKDKIIALLEACKGWYFDECQHLSAPIAQLVAQNTPNAYYRFGGSATAFRDDGADILIEAVTGRKYIAIPASFLIKKGILIKPKIHIIPINSYQEQQKKEDNKSSMASNYNSVYKHYIVENEYRNHMIKRMAEELVAQNLSVLILIKQIKHGDILEELIPGSIFIQGATSADVRQDYIQQLRDKQIMCMIATSLADEGLDIKTLNALIVAGSGKSSTRAFQRIGRVLRIAPGKTDAIAVDFYDNAPYLRAHSKRRIQLYESEPEFEIIRHT